MTAPPRIGGAADRDQRAADLKAANLLGPLPISTSQSISDATLEARKAAEKQRRKATAGTLATGLPLTGRTNAPAVLQPKTLLGY